MIDPNTRRNFSSLVAAAFADGHLADEERQVLHRKATEMNVPIRDMNEMIEMGRQGRISVGVPTSTREREELLESLIDIVCADGRVEASEHHLLAKFASHLKLGLPELRAKIRDRMEKRATTVARIEPRIGETRLSPLPPPPSPPVSMRQRPAESLPPVPVAIPQAPAPAAPAPVPSAPPGPVQLDGPKLVDPKIADIPPVTVQLIKQALSFGNDEDARGQVERMLGIPKEEAERVIRAVLAAFPALQRSAPPLQRPRR